MADSQLPVLLLYYNGLNRLTTYIPLLAMISPSILLGLSITLNLLFQVSSLTFLFSLIVLSFLSSVFVKKYPLYIAFVIYVLS